MTRGMLSKYSVLRTFAERQLQYGFQILYCTVNIAAVVALKQKTKQKNFKCRLMNRCETAFNDLKRPCWRTNYFRIYYEMDFKFYIVRTKNSCSGRIITKNWFRADYSTGAGRHLIFWKVLAYEEAISESIMIQAPSILIMKWQQVWSWKIMTPVFEELKEIEFPCNCLKNIAV